MIYVGYQGVGKSSISGRNNCIDLESGNFWVDGNRPADWYKYYANIAQHLSNQGYNVFTASHKVFRDRLKEIGAEFTVICPSLDLKDEWIKRLNERYAYSGLDKDYKALKNAEQCYDENIRDLMSEKNVIVIDNMPYRLEDYIK